MPISELRLVKRCAEFRTRKEIHLIPPKTRGIYALLRYRPRLEKYDVVYIGMAGGTKVGMHGRIRKHTKSRKRGKLWTHFSIFEVWENIREGEIRELEGIFRHIYRKDSRANRLNVQKSFKKLKRIKNNKLMEWRNLSP